MKAAFIPEVNDELDTQNFEKFEEVQYIIYLYVHGHGYRRVVFFVVGTNIILSLFTNDVQADKQTESSSKAGPWRKVGSCYSNFVYSWSTRVAVIIPFVNITDVDWVISFVIYLVF